MAVAMPGRRPEADPHNRGVGTRKQETMSVPPEMQLVQIRLEANTPLKTFVGQRRSRRRTVFACSSHGSLRVRRLTFGAHPGISRRHHTASLFIDRIDQATPVASEVSRRTESVWRPGQSTDQPVPHHPAAGRKIKKAIVAADIGMQDMLLGMLNEGATNAVYDALWYASRPG